MATQGGASRLAQMQMRFQQKQQQEREQRRLELTGPSKPTLDGGDTKSLNSTIGAGKVRQMFDERRKGTGIDKSYPLKPIAGRTSSGSSTTTTKTTTTTVRKQAGSMKQVNGKVSTMKSEVRETTVHSVNGNGIPTNEYTLTTHEYIDNESMPDTPDGITGGFNGNVPEFAKLSIQDHNRNDDFGGIDDTNNNNNSITSKSEPTSIKLKPVITKKTAPPSRPTPAPPATVRLTPRATKPATPVSRASPAPARPKTFTKTPPGSASSGKSVVSSSSSSTPKVGSPAKSSPRPATGPIPENMVQCRICGRNFNTDRIEKHQQICEKTTTKKRKVFDVVKHRVQGTEIEQYVRKGTRVSTRPTVTSKAATAAANKKNNWRKKHEEFIQAIRAAKEMKAFLAKGGKLSDLPPPPPSENPDYIQCPHCQRRFNEGAASRHIPKCANMLHNKPKPGAKAPPKRR